MMVPRIAGFKCCHSPAPLVTDTKSWPRNTPDTPEMPKSFSAKGLSKASAALRYSRVEPGRTGLPGMNFRVAGLGVASVWINMVEFLTRIYRPVWNRFKVRMQPDAGFRAGKP